MAGGLSVPRPPVHIQGGNFGREGEQILTGQLALRSSEDEDMSLIFIAGAQAVLKRALALGVKKAYLKDRSPSCAHDPAGLNPKGGPGQGVLTALLLAHDIEVQEVRA